MKWEDLRKSKNVEDRRGQRVTSRQSNGGLGGYPSGRGTNMGGLFSLLLMMPGIGKWLIIGLILLAVFGGGMGFGDLLGGTSNEVNTPSNDITVYDQRQSTSSGVSDDEYDFVSAVLASTEDYWNSAFKEQGHGQYNEPGMVIYTDGTTTSGCGFGSAQAGPFYCSADENVYIDLSFWRDLSAKYGAPGDFAMAYVIAHEVGHHVQNELGIMNQYNSARQRMSQTQANALNVRLELQADYYAGAWAKYAEEQGLLEIGDIEEALQAAHAVGDDTLQEQTTGQVVPDSFTHGSSQQRQGWFMRGYEYGDIEHGDTFNLYLDFD